MSTANTTPSVSRWPYIDALRHKWRRRGCISSASFRTLRRHPACLRHQGCSPNPKRFFEILGNCEMRLNHRLEIVMISILSLAIDFTPAYALSSSDCAGVSKLTNTCDDVAAYFHVCYGRDGEFGTMNFSVPPGESHQIHVQQYSTFISRCGIITPFMCPAGMGPLPLNHCD